MKITPISERDQRMLELLSKGDSSKAIAKKLGYRPGTTRVYLHDLYRKIGVANKTAAVIWYFERLEETSSATVAAEDVLGRLPDETVGDMAWRTDLFTTLGAMSNFVGPYGKLWQVAERLKGSRVEAVAQERARICRQLWEALLRGDFAYGKKYFDCGAANPLSIESSGSGILLALLLLLGGYSNAADRVIAELSRKKRAPLGLTAREHELLVAVRGVVNKGEREAVGRLQRIAAEGTVPSARQTALAVIHHVCKGSNDRDGAVDAAEALWMEAEGCLQHLQAMGEKPLYRGAAPATPGVKAPGARRKGLLQAR